MLDILRNCFTWQGRLGRADFCAGMLALGIPVTAFLGFIQAVMFFEKVPILLATIGFFFAFFFLWFVGLFVELSLFVRRLRDMGRHPVQVLYLLVPFMNFYILFLLFFGKSKVDSPETKAKGA